MKDITPHYTSPLSPTTPSIKKKDSSLLVAFIAVIILHISFLLFTALSSPVDKINKPKERLIVKTISLQPKPVNSKIKEPSSHQEEIAYLPTPPAEQPQPAPFNPPPQPPPPSEPPQPSHPPTPLQPPPPPSPEQPSPFLPPPQPKTPPTPPQPTPEATPQENVIAENSKVLEAPKPMKPIAKKTDPKKPVKAPINKPKPTQAPAAKQKKADPNAAIKKPAPATTTTAPKNKKDVVVKDKPKEVVVPQIDPVAEAKKARQKELMAKAKESIAKISQNRDKQPSYSSSNIAEANIPKAIESLQIDTLFLGDTVTLTTREVSYRDEIAHRLKLGLRLPDYGEVKIKLTLERSGKVSNLQIVSSKNQKNKQYIEKTLPTLTFAGFGDNFKGLDQYTFTICLNNEG